MFFQPLPYRADVVLDAGDLGRYRFSEDADTHRLPDGVTIRQELVTLLNELQNEFDHPVLLISGYRSQQHQIYLWATWLEQHPAKRNALNSRSYKSWAEWVAQSQRMEGWPPLASKHQTGDAVRFYWKGLTFDTAETQRRLTARIRELGGDHRYTGAEREQFKIPAGDNALFKVTAYREGQDVSLENPSGRAYFHVEYQPSRLPERPKASRIGEPMDDTPAVHRHIYEEGDFLYITFEDYRYLGRVMADVHATDTELKVWLYVDVVRDKLGDEISLTRVFGKRDEPKEGWGKKLVVLEYFDGNTWEFSRDAEKFADHYRLSSPDGRERRLDFDEVRYTIPRRR